MTSAIKDKAVSDSFAQSPKPKVKLNGQATDATPAQSSEDSCSESEKEMVGTFCGLMMHIEAHFYSKHFFYSDISMVLCIFYSFLMHAGGLY